MSQTSAVTTVRWLYRFLSVVFLFNFVACSDDGDDAPPPPPPPPVVVVPPPTSVTASELTLEITSAAIDNNQQLVVQFTATNENGLGVIGLVEPRLTVAKLLPGTNGDTSYWQSYIRRTKDVTSDFPNAPVVSQATNERDGTFVDALDGSYQYTFTTDVLNAVDPVSQESITWDENLTHRIGLEIRSTDNYPVANASFDFVPSGGAVSLTRDIAATNSCNQCHTKLAIHGGGRTEVAYCVTCHNPDTPEPISGETADFKVMVHKIHRGANLPRIAAAGDGAKYSIFGFRNSEHIYSENVVGEVTGVHFPQDIRNCTNCHVSEADKLADPSIIADATPDGDNWKQFPTIESCGGCHDDMAFNDEMLAAQPGMRPHNPLFPSSNEDCSSCHADGQLFDVQLYHTNAVALNYAEAGRIQLDTVSIAQATDSIDVTVSVTKDDMPVSDLSEINTNIWGADIYALVNWDAGEGYVAAYDPFADIAAIDAQVHLNDCTAGGIAGEWVCNWDTSAANGGNPIDSGTLAVTFSDAAACVDRQSNELADCTDDTLEIERIPTPLSKTYFDMTTLTETQSYEEKFGADVAACKTCHGDFAIHTGESNTHAGTDFAQCTSCHNASRISFYDGRPADLKFQVHKLHVNNAPPDGGHGVEHYPSPISNCLQCHSESQIDLPLAQNARPSLGTTNTFFAPGVYTSPTAVVCSSCHLSVSPGVIGADGKLIAAYVQDRDGNPVVLSDEETNTINHMILAGGAVFGATAAADATGTEACATCHSIGSSAGVDLVHGLQD